MTKPQRERGWRLCGPPRRGGFAAGLLALALLALSLVFASSASAHSHGSDWGGHSSQGHHSGKYHGHGSWQQGNGHYTPPPQHQTKTVSWVMVDASGSASHITYPQDELSPKHNPAAPTCGHTIQTDVYKYDTSRDKQVVDGLINGGVLNAGGDSSVVVSWSFTSQPACKTAPPTSPPPSHSKTPCPPTHTHTKPTPTPSKTHTPPPTKSTTPPPPPTTSTTPVTPPSTTTTTVVPPPVTTTVPPPTQSTTVVPPPTQSTTTAPPTHTKSTTPAPTPTTSTGTVPPVTFTPPPGNTGDSASSSPLGKIVLVGVIAVLLASGVAFMMRRHGRHA